jgi:hypothetical protein
MPIENPPHPGDFIRKREKEIHVRRIHRTAGIHP